MVVWFLIDKNKIEPQTYISKETIQPGWLTFIRFSHGPCHTLSLKFVSTAATLSWNPHICHLSKDQ